MQDPEDTWLPKQYRKIITGRLDTGELDTVGKGGRGGIQKPWQKNREVNQAL